MVLTAPGCGPPKRFATPNTKYRNFGMPKPEATARPAGGDEVPNNSGGQSFLIDYTGSLSTA